MVLPLSEAATVDSVENILVFVSDAMRADFLPSAVEEVGLTATAIAPSTFTASSIPSLTTGQYPASHRVWMFDDQLPQTPPLLDAEATDVGFDAEAVWIDLPPADKPPLQVHKLSEERTLEDLSPPFTHFVHDVGPHAPYGFENGVFESTRQFFADHEHRRTELVELYSRDCRRSAARFLDMYDELRRRDLLSETLLVFTADHGQCLGESASGGRFGHGHPMTKENVEVPLVFAGAGIPGGSTYDTRLSGTDVAPTALSAQGRPVPEGVDGVDLWRETPDSDRRPRADVWQHINVGVGELSHDLSVYAATSAWDDGGGHVFHREPTGERVFTLLYDNLFRGYAPAWRHNTTPSEALSFLSIIVGGVRTCGTPEFSKSEARDIVPEGFQRGDPSVTDTTLNEEQEAQLKDLGYL